MEGSLATSIHGSNFMSCEDHKPQNLFQLANWLCGYGRGPLGGASNYFCSWRIAFSSSVFMSSPSRCFRSCTFQLEIHSIMILSIGSSCLVATQSVTCRFTHAWVALSRTSIFSRLAYVALHQPQTLLGHEHPLFLPFQQWLHPGWTFMVSASSLWCDSAQGICGCIVLIPFCIQCWRWISQVTLPNSMSGSI